MSQLLSDRAKNRLRLAAGLLRGREKTKGRNGKDLPVSRTNFYNEIISHIESLPESDKLNLKEMVDWLESYVNEESKINASGTETASARRQTYKNK